MAAHAASGDMSQQDIDAIFNMFVLLYADDTVILAETAEKLQLALDKLYEYSYTWCLNINIGKTKIVVFSRGKIRKSLAFVLERKKLK